MSEEKNQNEIEEVTNEKRSHQRSEQVIWCSQRNLQRDISRLARHFPVQYQGSIRKF